jgi:hypothetical protein
LGHLLLDYKEVWTWELRYTLGRSVDTAYLLNAKQRVLNLRHVTAERVVVQLRESAGVETQQR